MRKVDDSLGELKPLLCVALFNKGFYLVIGLALGLIMLVVSVLAKH